MLVICIQGAAVSVASFLGLPTILLLIAYSYTKTEQTVGDQKLNGGKAWKRGSCCSYVVFNWSVHIMERYRTQDESIYSTPLPPFHSGCTRSLRRCVFQENDWLVYNTRDVQHWVGVTVCVWMLHDCMKLHWVSQVKNVTAIKLNEINNNPFTSCK